MGRLTHSRHRARLRGKRFRGSIIRHATSADRSLPPKHRPLVRDCLHGAMISGHWHLDRRPSTLITCLSCGSLQKIRVWEWRYALPGRWLRLRARQLRRCHHAPAACKCSDVKLRRRRILQPCRRYRLDCCDDCPMKGWKTRSFQRRFTHRVGTATRGTLAAFFSYGEKDYYLGGAPLWQLCRVCYRTLKRPFIVGGLAVALGYSWAALRGTPRAVSPELMRFHRAEQRTKLKAIVSALVLLKKLRPSHRQGGKATTTIIALAMRCATELDALAMLGGLLESFRVS